MNTLVIYHKNCFDGMASAWVLSQVYPDASFYAMAYGEELPSLNLGRDTDLIFVDFSVKAKELQELAFRVKSIVVIDHHKSAQSELQDFRMSNVTIRFDMNESGASLAWKHYLNDNIPTLVRYIKDRDLWLFKEFQSEAVNSFIQSYPMEIRNYAMLADLLETKSGFQQAIVAGEAIMRYKDTMVKAICKQANIQTISGYQVPVVNTSLLFSEVGHELCKQYPDYSFSVSYFDRADGLTQYSLRSIGDFDVSVVAKENGGGGHKNSAGFESNN